MISKDLNILSTHQKYKMCFKFIWNFSTPFNLWNTQDSLLLGWNYYLTNISCRIFFRTKKCGLISTNCFYVFSNFANKTTIFKPLKAFCNSTWEYLESCWYCCMISLTFWVNMLILSVKKFQITLFKLEILF